MSKRKSLSKKTRFEVLKRDRFTCQYCGAKAPDVILQIDHITAVANGGGDEILNLITSCDACNNGKGARPISDESAISKRRAQLEELEERREQIQMMSEWQNSLVDLDGEALASAMNYYQRLVPGWELKPGAAGDVRSAIARHGFEFVMSQIRLIAAKYVKIESGRATPESARIAATSLLGTLKYKERRDKSPIEAELRYIRGILRNRVNGCPMDEALTQLVTAHNLGVPMNALRDFALQAMSFAEWHDTSKTLSTSPWTGGPKWPGPFPTIKPKVP